MIDINAFLRHAGFILSAVAVGISLWLITETHELVNTNATLVDLLDTQLNVTQARMSRLEEIQRGSMEALLGDGAAAYVEVLRRETDK